MRKITISFPLACLLLLNGCASNNAFMDNVGKVGGTTLGAGIGAVIGKQVAGDTGLIVGALIGGGIGYLVGDEIDKRRAELAKIAKEEKVEVFSKDITADNLATINTTNTNEKSGVIGDSFTIISDDNQFNIGSSSLNPKSTQIFTKFAQQYKNSDKKILVIGHTDDSGDSSFNQNLSEQRARNVGKIFSNQGISQSNIYYLGAGEMNPIADNNDPEGANKNRRVEIVELKDVKDITIYSAKTSTPEYFRKIVPKTKMVDNSTNETKLVTKTLNKTEAIEKIIANKIINKNTSIEPIKEVEAREEVYTKEITPKQTVIAQDSAFIDFKGQKVTNNSFALKREFGDSNQEKSTFSVLNKAYADNKTNVYVSCLYDKPRSTGKAKSLETDKDVDYSTTEFKKGLNEVPWVANVDSHLIAINPVGVLANGSKITKNPKLTIYKDYSSNSGKKADLNLNTSINTYQGSDGLIYRVFLEDKNDQVECLDIVFNEKDINSSNGVIYYSQNDNSYERAFKITQITKK